MYKYPHFINNIQYINKGRIYQYPLKKAELFVQSRD